MKDIVSNRIKKAVYNIPQGYEARIEGNKVIVEAKENEDEKLVNNLISTLSNLYARNLIEKETKEKYTNFLKSLKDRVQPQPKYTWSEDEETMLKAVILNLEEVKKHCAVTSIQYVDKCIDWLKSLKPLDGWKPTAAQMYSLKEHVTYGGVDDELRSLYNDLIKLL